MSIDLGDFRTENVYNFLTFIYKKSQKNSRSTKIA